MREHNCRIVLYQLANFANAPWLVGGDFSAVLNDEEKIEDL